MNLPDWFEYRMRPENFSLDLDEVIEGYARACAEVGASAQTAQTLSNAKLSSTDAPRRYLSTVLFTKAVHYYREGLNNMSDYHFRITQPGSHSMSLSPDAQLHDELRDIVLAEYKKRDAPLPIHTDDKIFEILHQSTLDRIEALNEALRDCVEWMAIAEETPESVRAPAWLKSREHAELLVDWA